MRTCPKGGAEPGLQEPSPRRGPGRLPGGGSQSESPAAHPVTVCGFLLLFLFSSLQLPALPISSVSLHPDRRPEGLSPVPRSASLPPASGSTETPLNAATPPRTAALQCGSSRARCCCCCISTHMHTHTRAHMCPAECRHVQWGGKAELGISGAPAGVSQLCAAAWKEQGLLQECPSPSLPGRWVKASGWPGGCPRLQGEPLRGSFPAHLGPAEGVHPFPSQSLPFLFWKMGSKMLVLRVTIKQRMITTHGLQTVGCCAHIRVLVTAEGWQLRDPIQAQLVPQQQFRSPLRDSLVHHPFYRSLLSTYCVSCFMQGARTPW